MALDVLRYTGSAQYRDELLGKLNEHFAAATANLRQGDNVFLLGHSLGSVICLDFLLNRLQPPVFNITLVTGGSPITRFFRRYFPNQYFPHSLLQTVTLLENRLGPTFYWINVYRPQDPVGTSLKFPAGLRGVDLSTKQTLPWWLAHLDYWSDAAILASVMQCLRAITVGPYDVPKQPSISCTYQCPGGDYANPLFVSFLGKISTIARSLAWIIGAWVVLTNLWGVISSGIRFSSVYRELQQKGLETTAQVIQRRTVGFASECYTSYDNVFDFYYADGAGMIHHVNSVIPEDGPFILKDSYYNDYDKLRDCIRGNGELIENGRDLMAESNLRKSLMGVRVKYLPDRPEVMSLPDYPMNASWFRYALSFVYAFALTTFMGIMFGAFVFLALFLCLLLLRSLSGLVPQVKLDIE